MAIPSLYERKTARRRTGSPSPLYRWRLKGSRGKWHYFGSCCLLAALMALTLHFMGYWAVRAPQTSRYLSKAEGILAYPENVAGEPTPEPLKQVFRPRGICRLPGLRAFRQGFRSFPSPSLPRHGRPGRWACVYAGACPRGALPQYPRPRVILPCSISRQQRVFLPGKRRVIAEATVTPHVWPPVRPHHFHLQCCIAGRDAGITLPGSTHRDSKGIAHT